MLIVKLKIDVELGCFLNEIKLGESGKELISEGHWVHSKFIANSNKKI